MDEKGGGEGIAHVQRVLVASKESARQRPYVITRRDADTSLAAMKGRKSANGCGRKPA
jgi:hypothetical protein